MRVRILAVGTRPPPWVQEAVTIYARRVRGLEVVEVASGGRGDTRGYEGRRLLSKIRDGDHVIALDERGEPWSTAELARQWRRWQERGRVPTFVIGGADGLADNVLQRADQRWSLSALTLPHMLARVMVSEQIYRVQSMLSGHPYHRP